MSEQGDRGIVASRAELAGRAAAQEQRNKPRGVLYIGALVLVAGLIYLMVGRSSLASAEAQRRSELNTARNVKMQAARLERHRLESETSGAQRFKPVPNFTSLADSAAQSIGLTPVPTLSRQTQETPPTQPGLIERMYWYDRVTSRDLEALIGWVAQVEEMIPGVEISRLDLTPQRTQWQLSITFVKPELAP
ncbi:MAG: hypothetical protein NCW75_04590 [Phycisphaera sp.]|nr:MAG: hypothetical protein NCW75_04590 [Phycisphaera sp.]